MRHIGKQFWTVFVLSIGLPCLAFTPVPDSPKDEKIVFTFLDLNGKKAVIAIMDADGSKRTILTKGLTQESDPALSPDGKRIVFVKYSSEIWVMNADGKDRKRLMRLSGIALAPVWSPDGKRIAYTKMRPNEDGTEITVEMMVMDTDGEKVKSLGKGLMPSWSPDGKKIIYSLLAEVTGDKQPRLHVMDADGTNDKPLVKGYGLGGVWSPDGKRIAYLGLDGGRPARSHIYVCNADGSSAKQLTSSAEGEMPPRWSADSKRLYFSSMWSEPKKAGLRVIDADGKNEKEITKGDGLDVYGSSSLFFDLTIRGPFAKMPYVSR